MSANDAYTPESLNGEQLEVFRLLNGSSDNFYVTGKAGTGKSYLLRTFVRNTRKRAAVVAPTGIAAIQAGGQTIHSFFGLSTSIQAVHDQNAVRKGLNEERIALMNSMDVLIIDEVSMVRADVMDMIDAKLRAARESDAPFGGCQIVAFGDLYQLPPVVEDSPEIRQFFQDMYSTAFFFGAPVTLEKPFRIVELSRVMRQKDPLFVEILNAVREGDHSPELLARLNTRCLNSPPESGCVTLVPANSDAGRINHQRLSELSSEAFLYPGLVEGTFEKEDLPTEMVLTLKKGAQVMLLRNSPGKWVNGTIAVIETLTPSSVSVRTSDGVFPVEKEIWTKYEYRCDPETKQMERVPVGYFTQFPLRLAYAVTIHKSQGQTCDRVIIDYSGTRAFAPGQTYVALSRCRNFDSLYLAVPMIPEDISANQEVVSFMHGSFRAKPRGSLQIPLTERPPSRSAFVWRPDGRIEVKDFRKHKKITGTRLPNLLDLSEKISPFAVWCSMMHVYEEPYKDTIWTRAGDVIEPKQYEYVRKVMAKEGRVFIAPADRYGPDYKSATNYDFFRLFERFGGMWDYLMERDGKTVMVFEMKTTGINNRKYWMNNLPRNYVIQAALYAWLLKIDYFCMVCSFLERADYDAQENYVCNEKNTLISPMQVSKCFGNFERQIILPALRWWDDYIETGVSPAYDEERDREILLQLRRMDESAEGASSGGSETGPES